jgi:hypothetical protein
MPIDFRASLIHMFQRDCIVGQIVASPRTATATESTANCVGVSFLEPETGVTTSESGIAVIHSASRPGKVRY